MPAEAQEKVSDEKAVKKKLSEVTQQVFDFANQVVRARPEGKSASEWLAVPPQISAKDLAYQLGKKYIQKLEGWEKEHASERGLAYLLRSLVSKLHAYNSCREAARKRKSATETSEGSATGSGREQPDAKRPRTDR